MRREWDRYEGTPHRDLLRRLRERFLQRALQRQAGPGGATLEVGPGPGRFTPLLVPRADPLVLLDASRGMLDSARDRGLGRDSRRSIHYVVGDARWLPLQSGAFATVVALGNVLGFGEEGAGRILSNLGDAVGKGGYLVLETTSPVLRTLVASSRDSHELERWLLQPPTPQRVEEVLAAGFAPPPPARAKASHFRLLDIGVVRSSLENTGLHIMEEEVVAPLLGGDPERIAELSSRSKVGIEPLLLWEERLGSDARVIREGGHLLTLAYRPPDGP